MVTKWCRINALDCFLHTLDLDPDVISLGPYLIGSLNFGVSFVPQSCWLLDLAIIILNPLARPSWQALYNSPHYRDLYKFSSVARFAIVWALSTDLGHLVSTSEKASVTDYQQTSNSVRRRFWQSHVGISKIMRGIWRFGALCPSCWSSALSWFGSLLSDSTELKVDEESGAPFNLFPVSSISEGSRGKHSLIC